MIKEIWILGPNNTGYPGGFPTGFLNAVRKKGWLRNRTLHVCSGSVKDGVTLDINPDVKPTVVGSGEALPFKTNTFGSVLIDPPYSKEYARKMYGCKYPGMWTLLGEGKRVLKQGGYIGLVHRNMISPHHWPPWNSAPRMKRTAMIAVAVFGMQMPFRAFLVWQKQGTLKSWL